MMNLFALGLLLCTLVSGGFFSPPQQPQKSRESYLLKETDRETFVESERQTVPPEQTNHYPPPPPLSTSSEPSLVQEKLKQASSALPNVGSDSQANGQQYNPRELICDAYGKCKHRLAGVFGRTKEGAEDAVNKGKDMVDQAGESALGKAKDAVYDVEGLGEAAVVKTKQGLGKAKDSVYGTGEMAVEKTKEGLGKAKDSVYGTGEMAVEKTKEGLGKAKNSVYETGEMAAEKAKQGLDSVYETGEMAAERAKQGLGKAKDSVYETGEMAAEKAKQGLGKAKDSVYGTGEMAAEKAEQGLGKAKASDQGGMNLSNILGRGKRALSGAVSKQVVQPMIVVAHLLSLATAYGTMAWVTFMSSHVLAGTLPRQQFGVVQSKIYPAYFRFLAGSLGCALVTHALRKPYLGLTSFQAYNMLAALGLVLLNLLWLEPKATKVMFEKMKLEKEEGRGRTSVEAVSVEPLVGPGHTAATATVATTTETGPESSAAVEERDEVRSRMEELDKRLKNLNTLSSWLNVLSLMSQTWQFVYLGKALCQCQL